MTRTLRRAAVATSLLVSAATLSVATPALAQRAPAPRQLGLPPEQFALACAPTATYTEPAMPLRVTGGQDPIVHRTYAPGDLVTINAGTVNGMEVGKEFFVRRLQEPRSAPMRAASPGYVHTAGWVRIYAVDDTMSLATITYACDAIETGDYLEPFALPQMPAVAAEKPKAERDTYARVQLGDDLRTIFGQGDHFLIDRGSEGGVTPGAQFVIYRDKKAGGNFLYELGEAVAVQVGPTTSTLRVTLSRDAMQAGDYVAQRR